MNARRKLLDKFAEVCVERLGAMSHLLMEAIQQPDDEPLVRSLMREAHTLKGESRMLNLTEVNQVVHHVEDLLIACKDAGFQEVAALTEEVYLGLDLIRSVVGAGVEPLPPVLRKRAQRYLHKAGDSSEHRPDPEADEQLEFLSAEKEPSSLGDRGMRVERRTVETITHLSGELQLRHNRLRRQHDDLKRLAEERHGAIEHSRRIFRSISESASSDTATTIKINEGLVALERPAALQREMLRRLRTIEEAIASSSLRVQALGGEVTRMRLVDVQSFLQRYAHLAREMSREQGKQVRVLIEGEQVSADEKILEAISDSLLHLVRNATVHGIESPGERSASGKEAQALLRLRTSHAGALVHILLEDDGRGIDVDKVRWRLAEMGLLSEAEAMTLDEAGVVRSIFAAGLSTQDSVSDLSGRGVGLDIVRRRIQEVGGSVSVDSRRGLGTSFRLTLPVSITLSDVLLIRAGAATVALPSSNVDSVRPVEVERLEMIGSREFYRVDDKELIPHRTIEPVLGFGAAEYKDGTSRVVLLRDSHRRGALTVPRVVGEQRLVRRNPSALLAKGGLVTGMTVGASGEIISFLSVPRLLDAISDPQSVSRPEREDQARARKLTVAVVDDSDLTREMVSNMLTQLGYHVVEAVNGRDALEKIRLDPPDVVITDLDMPVMDGFELISSIRAVPGLEGLPVAVLTTRRTEDTKLAAMEAGAGAFVVKSSISPERIAALIEGMRLRE